MARRNYTLDQFAALGGRDLEDEAREASEAILRDVFVENAEGFQDRVPEGATGDMRNATFVEAGGQESRIGSARSAAKRLKADGSGSVYNEDHPEINVIDRGRATFRTGPLAGSPSGSKKARRGITGPTARKTAANFERIAKRAIRRSEQ